MRDERSIILTIEPDDLRQIALDLEDNDCNYCRTVIADDGTYIDIKKREEEYDR